MGKRHKQSAMDQAPAFASFENPVNEAPPVLDGDRSPRKRKKEKVSTNVYRVDSFELDGDQSPGSPVSPASPASPDADAGQASEMDDACATPLCLLLRALLCRRAACRHRHIGRRGRSLSACRGCAQIRGNLTTRRLYFQGF